MAGVYRAWSMTSRASHRGARGRKRAKPTSAGSRTGIVAALRSMKERLRNRLGRQTDDVWGLVLVVISLLLLLSFFNLAGPVGRMATSGLQFVFGVWSYFVPACLFTIGVAMVGTMPKADYGRISVGLLALFAGSMALFHLMTGTISLATSIDQVVERGGAAGSLIAFPLRRLIGFWGAFLVLLSVTGMGALLVTKATIRDVWLTIRAGMATVISAPRRLRSPRVRRRLQGDIHIRRPVQQRPDARPRQPQTDSKPRDTSPKRSNPKQASTTVIPKPDGKGYQLPPLELLSLTENEAHNKRALEAMAGELERALHEHGVDARLTKIVPGPTVTRYEIELAAGVKVSRVTGLAHDIAYALASADVRILAPIPGKSAIGIEVPNRRRRLVTLGDILSSGEAANDHNPLAVGLGKDIAGTPRLLNLDQLPHAIIAGATGAGKSSCINAMVTSILMRSRPDEVRLILVDPKRVELGQYNDVPHLLTRVITNPKKASEALQWVVGEMERRYELLADAGVRDITSYRDKLDSGNLDEEGFDRFPFIVIIVDELNDLMMVAGRTVEDSVVRIAQMARAVGIHLILATQRPSVNVITGVIKANVPSRLAFSVTSQTDSRVVLDSVGAEKLVGLGDMLVVTALQPKPERIQGAFVTEAEISAVVDWVREQQRTTYRDKDVFEAPKNKVEEEDAFDGEDANLVRQAIELIVRSQLGSTSMLQRKLRVGFARAGRIMDILETRGIVGPSEGSKARAVLITEDELASVLAPAPA
jgi:S-DNA-T family DNA segregation ATPase FtsK/SpoIIIE